MEDRFLNEHAEVPEHLRSALVLYVDQHYRPGGFLEAVLSNDLKGACSGGDELSREALFPIVRWLYNRAPAGCWGSPAKVAEWWEASDA
jgi:hypothetical protein